MTRDQAERFAVRWAEAWNARAVETVLDHFHPDVVFTSPTTLAVTGSPSVGGKEALRAYWTAALTRIDSLAFTLDYTLWDPARRQLAIIYTAAINGQTRRVSENLRFDEHDQVVAGEVFHGVPAPA